MVKKSVKKSLNTVSWLIVRRVILGITGLLLVWFIYQSAMYFLYHSSFFKVKKIVLSSTLSVIDKKDLLILQGQSLFTINVLEFYEELSAKYPQISDLKIYKQFPDRIHVMGIARQPFAQIVYKNKILTVDEDGILLNVSATRQIELSLIKGLQGVAQKISAGVKLEHNSLTAGLEILKVFGHNSSLKNLKILDVDVGNLSKITVKFDKGPDVLLDWTEIPQKSQMLTIVLSQVQMDFENIRYIDLRFKEPVVGRD